MRNKPFEGAVNIARNSGLRKLARAIRRGKVPDERQVVIDAAVASASRRYRVYLNSAARAGDTLKDWLRG